MRYDAGVRSSGHIVSGLRRRLHGRWHLVRKAISVALLVALLVPNIPYSVVYAQVIDISDYIDPDGQTATEIWDLEDGIADIFTDTTVGQTALNSFTKFSVPAQYTVNLRLPEGAINLVNLVHSETSHIDGMLNSIIGVEDDAKVGGNVFFLNPYGVVVGTGGVINVGSFTAFTPTLEFMHDFFDSPDNPSSDAVSDVLSGSVPISDTGLITVRGKINAIKDITLSAGDVKVDSTGLVQTGAVLQGVRVDFVDVVNANGLENASEISTEKGNIVIKAIDDIEMTGGTVASGGALSANAGAVTFESGNSISVSGQILAEGHGDNPISGDIRLGVQQKDHVESSIADAAAGIELTSATLKGNNIELKAQSDAKYEFSNELANLVKGNRDGELGYDLGAEIAIAQASANSSIEIGSGSTLEAKGNVTLTTEATATAEVSVKDKNKDIYFGIGFLYGKIDSDATIDVKSGATIRAANLSLSAKNTATLDVAIQSISENSNAVEAAVAVTSADVLSSAAIAQGASIFVTEELSISATNENSFSTSSTAKARENGIAGIAAAFFSATTQATAASDANLSGLTHLVIQAVDNTAKNATTSSGIAGGTEMTTKLLGAAQTSAGFIENKLRQKEPQQLDEKSGPTEDDNKTSKGPKLAGAVSISEAQQGATARIGAGASVDVGDSVVVAAQTQVARLQNKAQSSVVSKKDGHAASESLSAAVAYGNHERSAEALIGNNAQVKAQHVGVRSDVIMHLRALDVAQFDWNKLTGFSTMISGLKELKDIAGAPLLTSYANATESAEDLGIAGSVSYMDLTNTSKAYLAKGAKVTLKPTAADTWTTTMPNTRELSWAAPLSISANADLVGVFAAGNFSFGLSGTGGEEGAASAGGAYNHVNNTNMTKAFIAAGASVLQAEGQAGSDYSSVSVAAHTDQAIVAFAPTAGRTGNYGLNGAFSLADIDSATEASVSDKASVTAKELDVNAREDVVSWSLTGALSRAQSAGVGASVAINDVDTSTRAFIGPNSEDPTGDDSLPQGEISAQSVDVEAVTDGAIHTYSVAMAAATSSDPPNPDQKPGMLQKVRNRITGAIAKLTGKTENPKDAGGQGGSSDPQIEPKFGLAISGSSSVNLGKLNTEAYVHKGKLSLLSPEGADSALSIRGINSTDIIAASGGAALAKAGNKSAQWSAGIAGAVTYNELENTTSASLRESTVTGAKKVAVQGLAAGLQVSVALGVAVNASADQDKAASAAGSVSISDVSNKVESAIEDSAVEGPAAGPDRVLDVIAYDRTTIGTGGGSLIVGGKGGFGAAVTYSSIANTVDARIKRPYITAYDSVRVHGLTASLIGSGGAMAGFTKGEQSVTLAGSVVINSISNTTSAQVLGDFDGDNYDYIQVDDDIDVLARDTKDHAELDAIIGARSRGQVPEEEADEDKTDYSGRDFFLDEQSDDGDQSDTEDGTRIISVAGVVQASGSNVGISFAWNEVKNEFKAWVDKTVLEAGLGTNVEAQGGTFIAGVAVGVGVATGKFAGVASVTVNETRNSITAEVSDSTVYFGSLTVKATDKTQIHSLSGQVAAGMGKASAGGAIAHNLIENAVAARLHNAWVYTDDGDLDAEAVSVLSANESKIRTLSAAGGGAASLAFEASVSSAHVKNTTTAEVEYTDVEDEGEGDGSEGRSIDTDSVTVSAADRSEILSLSGGVAASKSGAVGGAASINTVSNTTRALVNRASFLVSDEFKVTALSKASIGALSASVAASTGTAAISGSATTSIVANTTEAFITSAKGRTGAIGVSATDESKIDSLAGNAALASSTAAVGGAATVGTITNSTKARVADSDLSLTGSLIVSAKNQSRIRVLGIAAGGASTAGVMGSITAAVIANTTEADIEDSDLIVGGTAAVGATDESSIQGAALTIAGSETAAVGGAAMGSAITNTARAAVSGGSLTVNSSGADALAVTAINQSTMTAVSATGGGSGTASVTGSATTSVIENTTEALVDDANLKVTGSTKITATDKSKTNEENIELKIESLAGSVSLSGTAAVGGAVTVNTVLNTTRARLSNTNVGKTAVGFLELKAANESKITTGAVGAGGSGTVAVTGSNTTSIISNTTEALLINAKMDPVGSLTVTASDQSTIRALAGNVGLSSSGAVGAAAAVNVISNTTRAQISGGSAEAHGPTSVSATNMSTIETIGASGGISGTVTVTGSVAVSEVSNRTEAEIIGADLRGNGSGSQISVLATDKATIKSISGAVGASAGVSIGAASSTNRITSVTTARVSGGAINNVGGLLVKGVSEGTIESVAVGVGADVNVGVAGSIAVNLIDRITQSYIDGGAKVVAQNNVGVLAENHDVVRNAAGAAGIGATAAGVGASVSVNRIGGSTKAYISGANTEVTALAFNPGRKLTIAEGGLSGTINLGRGLFEDSDGATIDFDDVKGLAQADLKDKRRTENVTGVAVNASSTRVIQNAVADVGGGFYAGVAGTASVNVITSSTEAYVSGSKVNAHTPESAGAGQGLSVKASDHAHSLGVIGTIGAGAAGVGAGVDTLVYSGTTKAYVDGSSSVRAKGAMVVDAQSTQSASSFAVSGAAGVVSVAGTGVVGVFKGTTEAYVKNATVNAGSLAVEAKHDSRLLIGAGGFAGGGTALNATFAVASDSSTARAYIEGSTAQVADDISVSAEGNLEIHNLAASGAGGATGSVAGSALVSMSKNTTEAYVKNSSLGSSAQRTGDVSILARDRVTVANLAGAAGVGVTGFGVGASAAVTRITNTTSAYVLGSSIYSRDSLTVDAKAERDLSAVAMSAGVGGLSAGMSGAVAVTLIGSVLSGDVVTSELNKNNDGTLSKLDGFAGGNRLNTSGNNANMNTGDTIGIQRVDTVDTPGDDQDFADTFNELWGTINSRMQGKTLTAGLTQGDLDGVNSAGKMGITDSLSSATPTGTTAQVNNSTIDVDDDVRIKAGEWFEASIHSGALGAGLAAGVGGSVGVMTVGTNVKAEVLGSTSILSRYGSIEIQAEAGRLRANRTAVSVNTYQGAGGLVGLGAAVSVANVTNNVTAQAGQGTRLAAQGTAETDVTEKLAVKARDQADVEAKAYGAQAGLVAAGVVAATATKQGATRAHIGATNGVTVDSGLLLVEAHRSLGVRAYSVAGAGGVVSGEGSVAKASDKSDDSNNGGVSASIADRINVAGQQASLRIEAVSVPEVSADARGYVGSLLVSVGVSKADASTSIKTTASIGDGGTVSAKQLDVNAIVRQNGAVPSAKSYAEGVGGAALIGAAATDSKARSSSTVEASVGSSLNITGDARVFASNATKEEAAATGVAGGIVGIGAHLAHADAESSTIARIRSGVSGSVQGLLSVSAVGNDDTRSSATSGSGGVVAGAAAKATTRNYSKTTAEVGASSQLNTSKAGRILLSAVHTATFDGQTDSINAAVVGASGAVAEHAVDSVVETAIRDRAALKTYDLEVKAENKVRKPQPGEGVFNASAGSGGLIDGAAARSQSDIGVSTFVTVGSNASITYEVDDRLPAGRADFSALNDIDVYDRAKLDAGGAIEIARAESRLRINIGKAEVRVGDGVTIKSVGTVSIGARTRARVSASANAKTYGLAGAADGISEALINTENKVTIASRAKIEAKGSVNLSAGSAPGAGSNVLQADAMTDLFNKTAFPIKTSPKADAVIAQNNLISTGSGSEIKSVRDVTLMATEGSAFAYGQGIGKDLYRKVAEAIANAFRELVGEDKISLEIKGGSSRSTATTGAVVDGIVHAGFQNKQRLTIPAKGTLGERDDDAISKDDGVTYEITRENVVENTLKRIEELKRLRDEYPKGSSAWGAYNAEIAFIENDLLRTGYAERAADGTIQPKQEIWVDFVNVRDVFAQGGNINVYGGYLAGSGTLRAPNDAEISIVNHSSSFLRLNSLEVDQRGGLVLFNGRAVTSAQQVNSQNLAGSPAVNLKIESAGSGSTPKIIVQNTFNPPLSSGIVPPDIELTGDITNRTGSVEITNKAGSIKLMGVDGKAAPSIVAQTVSMQAGMSIVQSYVEGLEHIGGDPMLLNRGVQRDHENWANDNSDPSRRPGGTYTYGSNTLDWTVTGSRIAGNNIFISARYLNINGTIQSGIPDWSFYIDPDAGSYYAPIYYENPAWVQSGRPAWWSLEDRGWYEPNYETLGGYIRFADEEYARYQWDMSHPDNRYRFPINGQGEHDNITAYYNPATRTIEIEEVKVQGGYVELYGEIMNTGGGKIKALDGDGRISITNLTDRDVRIEGLDTGDIRGLIRITDTGKTVEIDGVDVPITTVYERENGVVKTSQYTGSTLISGPTYGSAQSPRSASYSPVTGLRLYWTRGQGIRHEGPPPTYEGGGPHNVVPIGETGSYKVEMGYWLYDWVHEPPVPLLDGVYSGVDTSLPRYYFKHDNYVTEERTTMTQEQYDDYVWRPDHSWYETTKHKYVWENFYKESKSVFTHSIKADYPIGIEFIGYDSGRIDVSSEKSGIIVAGSMSNRGVTNLKGGSIRQTSDTAVVSGSIVSLEGANIGGKTDPIRAQLLGDSGALWAQAQGDISIRGVGGDMRILWISTSVSDGNVWLDAEGDIVTAGGFGIFGNRIELVSRAGSIGTAEAPVRVEVGDGSQSGLVAVAPGDISIYQAYGDLRLIRVESLAGDVILEAKDGSIIDVNPVEQKDTRTIEELNRLWDEMLLIEQEGAEKSAENTIKAYKQAKEYEYLRYWGVRNTRSQYDEETGSFVGYTWDPYDPNHTDPEYHRLHELYGAAGYDPDWEYTVSAEERNTLTQGVSWTRDELTMALSGGTLFKQTTSTETVYKEPNVKGRNITLIARKGSVGSDRGQVVIDGTNPDELKDEAKRIALAAAEPDDVAVDNDTRLITVLLRKPVNVAATGEVIVEARDNVYLSSRETINIRSVSSTSNGSIRIKGKDGVYAVNTSGSPVIKGGRTILEGGDGGLGTSSLPLILQLQAGAALTARAGQGIYITQASGDLSLAEVFGLGDVHLVAAGSILDSRGNRPLTVTGHGVNLTAQNGSVGEHDNPLAVATAPDGQLDASTPKGSVYLRASSTIFNVGTITSRTATSIVGQDVEDIRVHSITTTTLNIVAGSRILQHSSGVLRVYSQVTLNADTIDIANLMHIGGYWLSVSVGGSTGMADRVTIHATLDSSREIHFSRLEASHSLIDTDADFLKFEQIMVGNSGFAEISSKHLKIIADNSAWALHDCDLQLRPPIGPFRLVIAGYDVDTDADVVNVASGVSVYNLSGLQMTSLVSQAEEAVVIGGGLVMKPGVIGGGDLLVPLQGFGQPGLGVVTVQPGLMSGGTGGSDEGEEEF